MEKTVIVGLVHKNQTKKKLSEYLDELEFLSYTAGGIVEKRFTQRIENPNPATLIGKVLLGGEPSNASICSLLLSAERLFWPSVLRQRRSKNATSSCSLL